MKKILIIIAAMLSLISCQDDLKDRIDDLDVRITKLEELCKQMNNDISSVNNLVKALDNKDFITGITPVVENGEVTGYTINFKQGEPITIHYGENGKDGKVPDIQPKADKDGNYYWTIDGEWILNEKGNKIAVNAENGITPKLKIVDFTWYVSYNNGETWEKLGEVKGEDPNFIFKGVQQTKNELILTLQDGSAITLPKMNPVGIRLDIQGNITHIVPNKVLFINYTLENATENTVVTASSDGSLITVVEKKDYKSGVIKVLATDPEHTGHINVIVSDNGYTTSIPVNFYNGAIVMLDDHDNYYVPDHKCILLIPMAYNMPFEVRLDKDASSWMEVLDVQTKAPGDYHFAAAFIGIKANAGSKMRSGKVYIFAQGCNEPEQAVTVTQAAKATANPADMIFRVVAKAGNGYGVSLPLSGDVDCTIDWGDGNIETCQNSTKFFVEHFYDNITEESREFIVTISGKVSALYSYDLPFDSVTDILQWGDTGLESLKDGFRGNSILTSIANPGETSFANLSNIDGAFRDCFRLTDIPAGLFANCTELRSADKVFQGCGNLKDIPEDIFANCKNVTHAVYTFAETAIESIPNNIFASFENVVDFSHVFDNCDYLSEIPAGLFRNCSNVLSLSYAFARSVITEIPAEIFSGCPDVKDASYVFGWCSDLKSLPASLFDNNRKIVNFSKSFYRCNSLTGESPYTEIGGVRYHLYERHLLPETFDAPKETKQCFNGCKQLSDYAEIPTSWSTDY